MLRIILAVVLALVLNLVASAQPHEDGDPGDRAASLPVRPPAS
jgi:hypothetical protein